jgi:hypothetical protein
MKHKLAVVSIAMATLVLVSLCAVSASTSVSAADSGSSRASATAFPPNLVPAGTGPSTCFLKGTLNQYVFVKGYDGALWYRVKSIAEGLQNWGWAGGWVSLGQQLSSSPCAVSRQAGVIVVYVAATDGAVYKKPYYNGAWHNWVKIGGQVAPGTGPGASGWPGHEDIFIAGTNGAIYQKTYTEASGYTNWAYLGGKLTSSPAAVSRGPGFISLYARGTNGYVYGKLYYNGAWHNWFNIGGQVASGTGPAFSVWRTNLASDVIDRADVYITGTNGAMYQKTWTAASGWSNWKYLGGYLTSSPSVAMEKYCIEVYARGGNGYLYLNEYCNGAWTGWMGGMLGPPCQVNCG